ncbi:MAG: NAD-dependent protein deacylase [Eubacteriales bacterium]|nr:NAD-dependent protein deacylase [Eubacteriales bacterium]
MDVQIETLRRWLSETDNAVFFGGAGVSTESGIPDFRSADGLYNQKYRFPPETILSHSFFLRDPEEFFRFYHEKLVLHGILPNRTHTRLAELEAEGHLRAVITQNIDGLHQAAGSRTVLELHGSTHRAYCSECGRPCPPDRVNEGEGVPRCECGGVQRPDVVLYEEGLDRKTLMDAVEYIRRAEVLIVGGTSLAVYPAAGLIDYYRGNRLVVINRDPTPRDGQADLLIQKQIGEVFAQI